MIFLDYILSYQILNFFLKYLHIYAALYVFLIQVSIIFYLLLIHFDISMLIPHHHNRQN